MGARAWGMAWGWGRGRVVEMGLVERAENDRVGLWDWAAWERMGRSSGMLSERVQWCRKRICPRIDFMG
jgi:hypothetical protein